ncbi:CHAT domain-containing protein [Hugenholtzia roseola]|uniref:CHAT domain-containing protein n=1 Tax=Hugenholtzia roseola TaxID=1002 RepID=UPI0004252788|nr:CHAT domain-containing protein [Hugenholtzia roseola]
MYGIDKEIKGILRALDILLEKKEFLEEELQISTGRQKFALLKQVEQTEVEIETYRQKVATLQARLQGSQQGEVVLALGEAAQKVEQVQRAYAKMQPPVVCLAFANGEGAYLENLKQEEKAIRDALHQADDEGSIKLYTEFNTTIADLVKVFTEKYRNRVAIFHFAGHAGSQELVLDETSANATGFAQLLAQQQSLELVFLNGCSTKRQVEGLLEAGVKRVIATSTPIDDAQAVAFSSQFYKSLAKKATLGQAFQEAAALLTLQNSPVQVYRSAIPKSKIKEDVAPSPLLWGFYTKEEAQADWELPL